MPWCHGHEQVYNPRSQHVSRIWRHDPSVLNYEPAEACPVPEVLLVGCPCGARGGSAVEPSGAIIYKHFRLLDDPMDWGLLHEACCTNTEQAPS